MTIQRRDVTYDGPGGPFRGVAAWDDAAEGPRPGILIAPNFLGQDETDNRTAERLARLGYVALAADVFGEGKRTSFDSENPALYMNELNADRPLLLERMRASLAALAALPEVDETRLVAIGFCFGGKCVLDLARSGADVDAVVSFHGLYDRPPYDTVSDMKPKVLVCHGWDDRLAPPDTVVALAGELTRAGADWQLLAHGGAGHAFTDPAAKPGEGFGYHEAAAKRSWAALRRLLRELYGRAPEDADAAA